MKQGIRGILAGTILAGSIFSGAAYAQDAVQDSTENPPKDWFILDPAADHFEGSSVEKAYNTILKNKKSTTVTVAVIDSGVDIDHEDLQGKIWVNTDEIEGNGIDDDKNGYIDDRYGWNFIGGKDGNVEQDTYELTRIYADLKAKYGDKEEKKVKKKNREEYKKWLKVKEDFESTYEKAEEQYTFYSQLQQNISRFNTLLKAYFNVEKVSMDDLRDLDTQDSTLLVARNIVGMILQNAGEDADFDAIGEELTGAVEHFENQVKYALNTDFNPRTVVGDDYSDSYEKGYGNNDVKGHDPSHGTHVAGIIAANRDNNLGIKGIAENVKIMVVRAVPDGDERDKDVANAIIYAVDNGAQIINMSFGKSYSPQKEAVDKAVKYAESKGVLLIHAAGNSSKDVDTADNFPTKIYLDNTQAQDWMEIGASSAEDNEELVGSFSNYGKKTVNVFAPGVDIYSTTPNNTYESYNGTSMAAPNTSGVAALIMSYFPNLTAVQVKEIIMKSSRKFDDLKVLKPGSDSELIDFKELSISGGVINAYDAIEMAESMK